MKIKRKKKSKKEPLTVFEKQYHDYNFKRHYLDDFEFPTQFQRLQMLVSSTFWHVSILFIIFVDVVFSLHAPVLGSVFMKDFMNTDIPKLLWVMTAFHLIDIMLSIYVQYISKLEFLNYAYRPLPIIICETIGCIPCYLVVADLDLSLLMRSIAALKSFRLFYYMYKSSVSINIHIQWRLVQLLCLMILVETYFAWLYFLFYSLRTGVRGSFDYYVWTFETISAQIVGKGGIVSAYHRYDDSVFYHEVPYAYGAILILFFFIKPQLCYMIGLLTISYENRYAYAYKLRIFGDVIARLYQAHTSTKKLLSLYLKNYWIERLGYIPNSDMDSVVKRIIPNTLYKELCLDSVYDIFRHSLILRDISISAQRFLAAHVTHRLYMSGEFIYQKKMTIDYMVYIHRGNVDFLSKENGDVAIISLRAGTVLGEYSLIYPHKITCNVRCQSVSEVFTLHRNAMLLFQRSFPLPYHRIMVTLRRRVNLAKNIHNLRMARNDPKFFEEQLIWLKETLHRYKANSQLMRDYHVMNNIYMGPVFKSIVQKRDRNLHTIRFLQLLSIKPRYDINVDLVFVRPKCIWILRHDSPINRVWDLLVALVATALIIILPYVTYYGGDVIMIVFIYVAYGIFFLDIVLSLITTTSESTSVTTLKEVVIARCYTIGLYLDILSLVHFPIFGHGFPFSNADWIFVTHWLKIWKIYRVMLHWQARIKRFLVIQMFLMLIFTFFIYTYILGYTLALFEIIKYPSSPVGIQLATDVNFKIGTAPLPPSIMYLFINTFAIMFEAVGLVYITSAYFMKNIMDNMVYYKIIQLRKLSKRLQDAQLSRRLNSWMNTQINSNKGFLCTYSVKDIYQFPPYYLELLHSNLYAEVLKQRMLFNMVPPEVVKHLSAYTTLYTFHRHGMILRYGMVYDRIYVLVKGEACTLYGNHVHNTKLFQMLNLLEIVYKKPCVSNCVSLTETTVITFSYERLVTLLRTYPNQITALHRTIQILEPRAEILLNSIFYRQQVIIKNKEFLESTSFVSFKTSKMLQHSFEEYDYYYPYDKIYPFSFVSYFLSSRTILPDGNFLFYWELSRTCFAFTTSILFFIPPLSLQGLSSYGTCLLMALDVAALLDIYVRLHICYYNEDGVRISHPLYTARNYLQNGFFVDLCAMFPFYLFFMHSPCYRIVINLIHLLQLHRVFQFKANFYCTVFCVDLIYLIMTFLCPMNLITCFLYMIDCYEWKAGGGEQRKCRTFLRDGQLHNYLTVNYFIATLITYSGAKTIIDLSNAQYYLYMFTSFTCFISVFLHVYVFAYLFSCYNKILVMDRKFRNNLRCLVNFLRREKVAPYLRKQVNIYYEIYWHWHYETTPVFLMKNFNTALRHDMVYNFYGQQMHLHSQLQEDGTLLPHFYKCILFNCKPLVYPKNGYVLSLNDITSYIYILNKGSIDVVGADGIVIETICNGSFFGNIYGCPYHRQKVSFVTNTVATVVAIKSVEFMKILNYYPKIANSFKKLSCRKFYYVPSNYELHPPREPSLHQLKAAITKFRLYHYYSWLHFILACCIGIQLELYQLAVRETHSIFVTVQICLDVIHLTHQYMKFSIPFINMEEEFIIDSTQIKQHTKGKNRIWFKLYFCNVPLDWIFLIGIWLFEQPLTRFTFVYSLLRMNRFIRVYNIIYVYYNARTKITSYSRIFKILLLFMILLISLESIAAIIGVIDYGSMHFQLTNSSQIIDQMPPDHLQNLITSTHQDRFVIYTRYLYVSVLLHTFAHDDLYYPMSFTFEVFFIIMFMYVMWFDTFLMVHYYQILIETQTLVKIMYNARKYVEAYYRLKHATHILREQIDEVFHHYFAQRRVCDDFLLHHNCPTYLKESAMMSIYGYLFKNHPFFENAHPDLLRQLSRKMHCVLYPTNSIIVNKFDCQETLYFVHVGEVAAVSYDTDWTGDAKFVFCKGDSFGFKQAHKSTAFVYTYRTITFCEIIELDWCHVALLLDYFPLSKSLIEQVSENGVTQYIQPRAEGADVLGTKKESALDLTPKRKHEHKNKTKSH